MVRKILNKCVIGLLPVVTLLDLSAVSLANNVKPGPVPAGKTDTIRMAEQAGIFDCGSERMSGRSQVINTASAATKENRLTKGTSSYSKLDLKMNSNTKLISSNESTQSN